MVLIFTFPACRGGFDISRFFAVKNRCQRFSCQFAGVIAPIALALIALAPVTLFTDTVFLFIDKELDIINVINIFAAGGIDLQKLIA